MYFCYLSDTTVNMGDTFCLFPLYAASISLFCYATETSRMRSRERCPIIWWGKTPLGGILHFSVPNAVGASFPNGQLLIRSKFSYSKHYRHWKCRNIIQPLCSSPDKHFSKSGDHGSKSRRLLTETHEARHSMLIPT